MVHLAETHGNFLHQRILHYISFYKIFLLGMQTKPFKYEGISQYLSLNYKIWHHSVECFKIKRKAKGNVQYSNSFL